jgi:hypothetical protein
MRRALTVLAIAALAGCGGGDDEEQPRPKPPPATLTAAQIQDRFRELTGDGLAIDREFSDERKTILDPTADFSDRAGLYGSYGISVYKNAKTARTQAAQSVSGDRQIKPVDGVYWLQYPGDDSWEARQVFANFVLDWEAPDERKLTDERWDRLVRIAGAIAGEGELPPEDQPCKQAGIDPAKGKEGTCKQGGQTLIVVNQGKTMTAPGIDARLVEVKQDGTSVVTRIEIRNKTDKEIVNPFALLSVGARRFKDDSAVSFKLKNDFPLAPGETGETTFVYDIPKSLAKRAMSEGGVLIPGDKEQFVTVPDATVLGRLRLAR